MFQHSLNGLNAYSRALDTIGHNLSNSENIGFKKMKLHFSDVYTSLTNNGSAGGVSTPTSVSEFKQGTIVDTTNPLDLAIRGNGFFQVSDNTTSETFYTRNGQFKLKISSYEDSGSIETQKSYLVDANGNYLMGWQKDQPSTGATSPLVISHNLSAGKQTTKIGLDINLKSSMTAIGSDVTFDPKNPQSYNWATSTEVYDSKGDSHELATYYVKTQDNTWNVYTRLDDELQPTEAEPQELSFSAAAQLTGFTPFVRNFTLTGSTNATLSAITIDMTGSTQYDEKSTLNKLANDGYGYGHLNSFRVEYDGTVVGEYSNGYSQSLGRVALARFTSPEGLLAVGGNLWAETINSGAVELWPDAATASASTNSGSKLEGWGAIQSGAIEQSTTETADDMVALVIMQRNYQANAKGVETQDKMIQSLLDMKR